MYEELNNKTIQNLESVNMDLLALYNDKSDIIDEFKKRAYPLPKEGEVLIKID